MTLASTSTGVSKTLARTTLRASAAAALLAAAALASGCETVSSMGMTSPYFQTADGYLYKYGNFCGGGWPNYPAGNTPEQNVAFLEAIEPVDDVDRVCRAHDRCYFEYGADNASCDLMLAELLRDHSQGATLMATGSSFLTNEFNGKCANLAGEILTAVGQFKQGEYLASLAQDEEVRNQALGLMAVNAVRNMAAGFPETPGLCFFNDNQRAAASSPAEAALYAAAQLASGKGMSLTSFEPFFPADETSLAAGRAALMALQAQAAADEAAAASTLDAQ